MVSSKIRHRASLARLRSMPDQSGSQQPLARPVKLRESCDSCLLAKVKCSKARPLCSRCLSNGAPCDYSPSSRAGKRNRNNTSGAKARTVGNSSHALPAPSSPLPPNTSYLTRLMYPLLDEEDRSLLNPNNGPIVDGVASPLLQHNTGIKVPLADGGIGTMHETDGSDPPDLLPTPPFSHTDFMESFMPMSAANGNPFAELTSRPTTPTMNMDQVGSNPLWTNKDNSYNMHAPNFQGSLDMMPTTTSNNVDTASRPHSHLAPSVPSHVPSSTNLLRNSADRCQTCDCFAACLLVLQSLHNHSSLLSGGQRGGPPFDIVLTINREAIESCSTMLECTNCLSRSGRSISTMMLATIFGKVMSLYRAACFLRFGSSESSQSSAQLAFGAYTVTGENRKLLEIEILLLELRKVEQILEVYSERFRNAQTEKGDESDVYSSLTSYLERNLQYIVEFLKARKGSEQS